MKKRMLHVLAFVALVSLGLGLANSSLSAINNCLCFNEGAAWELCEELCDFYASSTCIQTVETSDSYCVGTTCTWAFWSVCQNLNQYRRWVDQPNCPSCN